MSKFVKVYANGSLAHGPNLDPPDDAPTGDCPTCGGETDNWQNHGCGEDCRRGCRQMAPAKCDLCAAECPCCGKVGEKFDEDGYCEECEVGEAEITEADLHRMEREIDALKAQVAKLKERT